MKKTYQKPEMATYNVQAVTPLALSTVSGAKASDGEVLGKRRYADDEDDLFDSADIW